MDSSLIYARRMSTPNLYNDHFLDIPRSRAPTSAQHPPQCYSLPNSNYLSSQIQHMQSPTSPSSPNSQSKTYSFISLPGNSVKKRPRRRYDEIERLYKCSFQDCTKAYGTLNHLNAHVVMQGHGGRRSPTEFKELRRQWRKAKKEAADANKSAATLPALDNGHFSSHHHGHHHHSPTSPTDSNSSLHHHHGHGHHHSSPPAVNHQGYQQDHGSPPEYEYSDDSQEYSDYWPSPHNTNRLPLNSTLLTPLPGYQSSHSHSSHGSGLGGYQGSTQLLPPLMSGLSMNPQVGYHSDVHYDYSSPVDAHHDRFQHC